MRYMLSKQFICRAFWTMIWKHNSMSCCDSAFLIPNLIPSCVNLILSSALEFFRVSIEKLALPRLSSTLGVLFKHLNANSLNTKQMRYFWNC